jgi:hypothetical protein
MSSMQLTVMVDSESQSESRRTTVSAAASALGLGLPVCVSVSAAAAGLRECRFLFFLRFLCFRSLVLKKIKVPDHYAMDLGGAVEQKG